MAVKENYSTKEALYYLGLPAYRFKSLRFEHSIKVEKIVDNTKYYKSEDIKKLKIILEEALHIKALTQKRKKKERLISDDALKIVRAKLGGGICRDIYAKGWNLNKTAVESGYDVIRIRRATEGNVVDMHVYVGLAVVLGFDPFFYVKLYTDYVMAQAKGSDDINVTLSGSVYREPI